jgi:hypothetical protein
MLVPTLFSFNNYTVYLGILPRPFYIHTCDYCEKGSKGLIHKQREKCAGKLWTSCFQIPKNFLGESLMKASPCRICLNCLLGLYISGLKADVGILHDIIKGHLQSIDITKA